MSRIAQAFEKARSENRAAFIAYLTAGDPDAEATIALARALDRAGADILELGVPFTDPIADGPVLQRAAARALSAKTSLSGVLAMARRIRDETDLALVLFS
jgi:tryptophan synthase alpha chain